jgi:hypothetical protein
MQWTHASDEPHSVGRFNFCPADGGSTIALVLPSGRPIVYSDVSGDVLRETEYATGGSFVEAYKELQRYAKHPSTPESVRARMQSALDSNEAVYAEAVRRKNKDSADKESALTKSANFGENLKWEQDEMARKKQLGWGARPWRPSSLPTLTCASLTYRNCSEHLYGGKIAENAIQGMCRDLLADALVRLERAGLPPVMHVHDEPVCEVPIEALDRARDTITAIMTTMPAWADGFPPKANVEWGFRYRK